MTTEEEKAAALQREIEEALLEWWFQHRPVMWSVKDHMGNPTINMTGGATKRLANAAAELAAKQLLGK